MTLFADCGRMPLPASHRDFGDLERLESDLLDAVGGWEAFEEKLRGFFRSAIDEVIDSARTGRFFFSELEKTEKTYLGTKFEIILRDWLGVPKGIKLDLLIGGSEVDVKSSTAAGYGGWMIPPEAFDELCILIKVNEVSAICDFGLARARPDYLRKGSNRDAKTSFSADGRKSIWWMAKGFHYTPNFWTLVSHDDRDVIMSAGGGSKRIAALFEPCKGVGVSRVQIEAVAAQDDFMKRLRANGGARDILRPKGIVILYSETDRELMKKLDLRFGTREFVSFKPTDASDKELLQNAGLLD